MQREIELIVNKLVEAKKAYYNGKPIMTDELFDLIESELRAEDPENSYFSLVGAPIETQGNKIKHAIRMKSMDKAKKIEDVIKWQNKIGYTNDLDYIIQGKIDGLSATLRYKEGKLLYVATRGDGDVGQDISHIIPYIDDIKETISFTNKDIEIRGEIYLPTDTEYDTKGKALRNNAVGLINRKSDKSSTHYLRFVAYIIIGEEFPTEEEKLLTLQKAGFNTVVYMKTKSIEEIYNLYLNKLRSAWTYETDGIILLINNIAKHAGINSKWKENDHHNFWSLAFKPPSEGKNTTLRDIVWQMSRQGNLIPVGVFNPISIGGAEIERTTLHNYKNVAELQLSKGDKVFVERANDVIPYFKENFGGGDNISLIPTVCPHCGSILQEVGVHLHCANFNCTEQVIQRIIYWVKEADIDNVAEGMLRAIYEEGLLNDVSDLYKIRAFDLNGIEGIGDKKIQIFIEGMKGDREIEPVKLLSRLNIPLVRTKALKKVGIETIDDFMECKDNGSAISRNIVEWRSKGHNIRILSNLTAVMVIKEVKQEGNTESLGKVCVTGKSSLGRKDLIKIIEDRGYEYSTSVSKDLSILLVDDVLGTSSKLVKARKLGVNIMLYEEFLGE